MTRCASGGCPRLLGCVGWPPGGNHTPHACVLPPSWFLGCSLQVHEYPFLWGNYPFDDFKPYSEALDKAW